MNERTEGQAASRADQLSDRAAGGLLLAFLATVIVILAAGTFTMSTSAPERTDDTMAASHRF